MKKSEISICVETIFEQKIGKKDFVALDEDDDDDDDDDNDDDDDDDDDDNDDNDDDGEDDDDDNEEEGREGICVSEVFCCKLWKWILKFVFRLGNQFSSGMEKKLNKEEVICSDTSWGTSAFTNNTKLCLEQEWALNFRV